MDYTKDQHALASKQHAREQALLLVQGAAALPTPGARAGADALEGHAYQRLVQQTHTKTKKQSQDAEARGGGAGEELSAVPAQHGGENSEKAPPRQPDRPRARDLRLQTNTRLQSQLEIKEGGQGRG
eukprot:CAMPEP_0184310536 /NCGR_PEP_ID=MMETSP1049-20130417/31123_1 /TAXON_ID=77928 /ORGANISM="Proteomonas sulcata, Strain CCMP704" /LENGTH=126 /DNA_ID=CAMNT_0026624845 /DNA_START=488 /DNA_END=863 /DNA_ORIENTATION=+